MHWPFDTASTINSPAVKTRRYGVIVAREGKLAAIHFRPYPKFASQAEAWLDRITKPYRSREDGCRLYYNEPRSCPGFLTLAYLVSSGGATLASVQAALAALDEIARMKRSDAIVCEASNLRLSTRLVGRFGYEPHADRLRGRHFIKRFSHPAQYEFLRRPLAEIFPEQGLALGEIGRA